MPTQAPDAVHPDADRNEPERRDAASGAKGEHYVVCPVCGQIYDGRDPDAVTHHGAVDHAARFPSAREALNND